MIQRVAALRIAVVAVVTITSLACESAIAAEKPAKRPNFVWLMSEDNSVHYMDLYFETGAPTPNIEKMAKGGRHFQSCVLGGTCLLSSSIRCVHRLLRFPHRGAIPSRRPAAPARVSLDLPINRAAIASHQLRDLSLRLLRLQQPV